MNSPADPGTPAIPLLGRTAKPSPKVYPGVPSSSYFVAAVNTSHEELFWNFTYVDGVVSPQSAQRFADGCLQTLLGAME